MSFSCTVHIFTSLCLFRKSWHMAMSNMWQSNNIRKPMLSRWYQAKSFIESLTVALDQNASWSSSGPTIGKEHGTFSATSPKLHSSDVVQMVIHYQRVYLIHAKIKELKPRVPVTLLLQGLLGWHMIWTRPVCVDLVNSSHKRLVRTGQWLWRRGRRTISTVTSGQQRVEMSQWSKRVTESLPI